MINAGSHSVYIFVDYSKRIGHYTIKALLKKCDIVVISVEMYGIVVISVQLANLKDEPTRQGNKISVSMKVLIMVSNKLHPSMTHQKALTYINIAKLRHLRLTVTSQGASLYESSEEPPSCSHRYDQLLILHNKYCLVAPHVADHDVTSCIPL